MSKELTEQWRSGTLKDGAYYILVDKYEQNEPEIDVGICYNSNFEWWIVKEVLAPVPDYMDCKGLMYDSIALDKVRKRVDELVSKTERLEQLLESETLAKQEGVEIVAELEDRLKEAENIILLYFKNTQNATHQSLGMNDGYYKKAFMHTVAKEYLEKYGVEK